MANATLRYQEEEERRKKKEEGRKKEEFSQCPMPNTPCPTYSSSSNSEP
jgi:hypothetical protein